MARKGPTTYLFMATQYQEKFPAVFSEYGRDKHLYLTVDDFKSICNKADDAEHEADLKRVQKILDDLREIRLKQKSTGGEIRIYGRSLRTSEALTKSIHPKIRKDNFVEVIGLSGSKQNWKDYPWPRVYISNNGVMTADDQKLMNSDLDKKVLIIMSGGEGRSDEPFYRPIAQFMSRVLQQEIYVLAVCMSYQVIADQVLCIGIKRGQHVPPPQEGMFHVGTQVVDLTDLGKRDEVFSELAPAFAVESFNHYRIYGADLIKDRPAKNIQILARDRLTNEVVAYKAGETCWAIQYHPEIKKIGRAGKGLQHKRSVNIHGKTIIIPKQIHTYQETLINILAKNPEWFDRYHMTADDLQQFFHPARRVQNVGDRLTLGILEQAVAAKKRQLGI
ncbi:MAG: hypothetical protein Q8P90_04745 [bacterium]|nr:hypothetical protein [bacterium]